MLQYFSVKSTVEVFRSISLEINAFRIERTNFALEENLEKINNQKSK